MGTLNSYIGPFAIFYPKKIIEEIASSRCPNKKCENYKTDLVNMFFCPLCGTKVEKIKIEKEVDEDVDKLLEGTPFGCEEGLENKDSCDSEKTLIYLKRYSESEAISIPANHDFHFFKDYSGINTQIKIENFKEKYKFVFDKIIKHFEREDCLSFHWGLIRSYLR